jgi:hypothetical protein
MKIQDRVHNSNIYATVSSRNTPIGDVAVGDDVTDAVYNFADLVRNTTGAELVADCGNTVRLFSIIP